ncbi:Protein TIC 20-v [Hibiscus syriacus]|uniref:Multifunctional fusion protein n=1 Tax=Hibiscus syriacus TaxID=106335 RepID=A0A6A2ZNX3_HIBSY|nr:Protein TIC 20-v [Hibiscus syriacus]
MFANGTFFFPTKWRSVSGNHRILRFLKTSLFYKFQLRLLDCSDGISLANLQQSSNSGRLICHADVILARAAKILKKFQENDQTSCMLVAKIGGMYWWYKTVSHPAELTGYYNTALRDGYDPVVSVLSLHGAALHIPCFEMVDSETPPTYICSPEGLLKQTGLLNRSSGGNFRSDPGADTAAFPGHQVFKSFPLKRFSGVLDPLLRGVRNPNFSRYVRFNTMQAIVLDVLLIFPDLLERSFNPREGLGLDW